VTDLARLVVKLTAQTAEYEKKLDQANAKLSRFAKNTDGQLKGIGRSFAKFNNALGAIGVGFGLAVVTRGLAGAAAKAIEYGDEISKAAARTGVGAEAFSELAFAAKMSDIEMSSLTTAFQKLQKKISEAGTDTGNAAQLFEALGLEFSKFRSLEPDKQFELIAEQISRIKDPADKARIAVELFGRSGAELLPLFEQGAEGIRKAREEAQRMGASLTDEQVKKLADADDAIKRLSSSWDSFARTLTGAVAPALTRVFDILSNADAQKGIDARMSQIEALLKSRGPTAGQFGDNAALQKELATLREQSRRQLLGEGRQARRPGTGSGAPDLSKLADPDKPGKTKAADIFEDIAVTAQRITVGATEQMYRDMDAATQTTIQKQVAAWSEFESEIRELVASDRITPEDATARLTENMDQYLEDIQITAEKVFPEQERKQLNVFWEEAARNTQDLLADFLFDPFENGIKGMLDSFMVMLRRMAAEAIAAQIGQKIFGAVPGTGGGLLGSLGGLVTGAFGMFGGGSMNMQGVGLSQNMLDDAFASIPGFASGGQLGAGQWGVVGEKGPERAYGGRTGLTIQPNGGGATVNNHFVIQAPTGTVSRQTQMQVAAAAARGAARASERNN
jgi:hypothetical protein